MGTVHKIQNHDNEQLGLGEMPQDSGLPKKVTTLGDDERKSNIAKEAKKYLAFNAYPEFLPKKKEIKPTEKENPISLVEFVIQAGIPTLNPLTVNHFKEQYRLAKGGKNDIFSKVSQGGAWVILSLTGASLFWFVIFVVNGISHLLNGKEELILNPLTAFLCVLGFTFLVGVLGVYTVLQIIKDDRLNWHSSSIEYTKKEVPVGIIEDAVTVAKTIPRTYLRFEYFGGQKDCEHQFYLIADFRTGEFVYLGKPINFESLRKM